MPLRAAIYLRVSTAAQESTRFMVKWQSQPGASSYLPRDCDLQGGHVSESTTLLKCCRKCGQEKPATLEYFYKASGNKDGLYSQCKTCHAEWAKANPERIKKAKQGYAERNREAEQERARRFRVEQPEKARETVHNYYLRNKDKRLVYNKEWAAQNPEKMRGYFRAYHERNPFVTRQQAALARAKKYGVAIDPATNLARVYKRDRGVCYLCSEKVTRATLSFDHVLPLSKGGPHAETNLAVAHVNCNRAKRDTILET